LTESHFMQFHFRPARNEEIPSSRCSNFYSHNAVVRSLFLRKCRYLRFPASVPTCRRILHRVYGANIFRSLAKPAAEFLSACFDRCNVLAGRRITRRDQATARYPCENITFEVKNARSIPCSSDQYGSRFFSCGSKSRSSAVSSPTSAPLAVSHLPKLKRRNGQGPI